MDQKAFEKHFEFTEKEKLSSIEGLDLQSLLVNLEMRKTKAEVRRLID